jgi:hypothetical protein
LPISELCIPASDTGIVHGDVHGREGVCGGRGVLTEAVFKNLATGVLVPELKRTHPTKSLPVDCNRIRPRRPRVTLYIQNKSTGADKEANWPPAPNGPIDANDYLYQWDASHDYNPSAGLEKIEATLLAINAADDQRNPPETGVTDTALKRVKNGRLYLIPASTETRGHGTTGNAAFYKQQLQELLQRAPQRTM